MMNNHQDDALEIEFRIWQYLDGDCMEQEKNHIEQRIAADPLWKAKYAELLAVHQSLGNTLELEEPSMRFTQNVIDAIAPEKVLKPVKSYLNQWVIRGLTAFFIIVIGYNFFPLLGKIVTANSTDKATSTFKVDYSIWLHSTNVIAFLCAIAFVVLLDTLMRRKKIAGL